MARMLLVTALLTSALFATDSGRRAVTSSVDFAKTMVTTFELSTLRDAIVMDFFVTGRLPPTHGGFEDYVRSNLDSRGERDSAIDLWESPYQLEHEGGPDYLLRSLGPNGYADAGCEAYAADPYAGWEDHEYTDDFAEELAEHYPEDEDDDVCVRFALDPHADSLF